MSGELNTLTKEEIVQIAQEDDLPGVSTKK